MKPEDIKVGETYMWSVNKRSNRKVVWIGDRVDGFHPDKQFVKWVYVPGDGVLAYVQSLESFAECAKCQAPQEPTQ